jgi:hypothetical protein
MKQRTLAMGNGFERYGKKTRRPEFLEKMEQVVPWTANIADATALPELLHGEEPKVWGDQAYCGQNKVIQECAPLAQELYPATLPA